MFLYIYFIFLEGKNSPKETTSKSKDEYSSSLGFSTQSKESRDGQTTKSYNPEEKTVHFISTCSYTTVDQLDQIATTLSDHNHQDPESKQRGFFFWLLILLPSSSVILILIALVGWRCGKMIKKRRRSADNPVNINFNEDFEMASITNEYFQETSFDGTR